MNKKIIIVLIIFFIILAVILGFAILKKPSEEKPVIGETIGTTEKVEPKVSLTKETKNGETIINVEASIEGDNSILEILLPDGETVQGDTAEYKVSKAGEYEFTVTASNGVSVVEKITIDNVSEVSASNPYIPDGFTHVSDTEVETGYVIKDDNDNEFVWVPVESGRLTRNTNGNDQYEESDSTATGLYNSVAKYYGFYIGRYEASKAEFNDAKTVASKADVLPWANVTYLEAYDVSNKMASVYGYSKVKTALINSYAWDTALNWLNSSQSNYSSNTSYGNYSGTILETGKTSNDSVNSICDMAGNLREWTTEIYYPGSSVENTSNVSNNESNSENLTGNEVAQSTTYRVIRGGSANINKVANSHIGQLESMSDSYWGFRVILYKD